MSIGYPPLLYPATGTPAAITCSTTETVLMAGATGMEVSNRHQLMAFVANADATHTCTIRWYETVTPTPAAWTAAGPNPDWAPVTAQTVVLAPTSGPVQLASTQNVAARWLLTGTAAAATTVVDVVARATYQVRG